MPLRISRTMALIVGLILPCVETWRRWPIYPAWPSWLDDSIAAALLLYAWHIGRKDPSRSRPYLMAAWAYTFGIAYMSFFGQIKSLSAADPSGMPMEVVIGFKGFGLAISACCLGMAWKQPDS